MIHKSTYVQLKRNASESDKEYAMRKWFVAKNMGNKSIDFNTLEMLSNNYIKNNIYGLTFHIDIMSKLKECEQKLHG